MLLVDSTGEPVEQYVYEDYGQPEILNATGNVLEMSAVGNTSLFTGRQWDLEEASYHYRTRLLDPLVGRFEVRDLIGLWGDTGSLGNAVSYVGNSPGAKTDPFGYEAVHGPRPMPVPTPNAEQQTEYQMTCYRAYKMTIKNTEGCNETMDSLACGYIHCVNNCLGAKYCGHTVTRMGSYLVEKGQKWMCKYVDADIEKGDAGGCWSADQDSDWPDNAMGRDCARKKCNDCYDCCAKSLGGRTKKDLPEGFGTPRPPSRTYRDQLDKYRKGVRSTTPRG
jgi:RHS repeat-associated protein